MDFTIERTEFLQSLRRVKGIVKKREAIPILSNIRIKAGVGPSQKETSVEANNF